MVAMGWLFTMGIAVPIIWIFSYGIGFIKLDYLTALFLQSPYGFAILAVGVSCIIPAISLHSKDRLGWKDTMVTLSILIICFLAFGLPYLITYMTRINDGHVSALLKYYPCSVLVCISLLLFILYAVPFILLIIDRKNYFEMIHQRKLEDR
jgi:hypothetical protein